MWLSRIPKRSLFTHVPIPDKNNLKNECNQFIISMSKVIIFSSILWGFESYTEKNKYIQQNQYAVDNVFYECLRSNRLTETECHNIKTSFQESLKYY